MNISNLSWNLNIVLKRQTQNGCGGKLNTLRIYIVSAGHDVILGNNNNNIMCTHHCSFLVELQTTDAVQFVQVDAPFPPNAHSIHYEMRQYVNLCGQRQIEGN